MPARTGTEPSCPGPPDLLLAFTKNLRAQRAALGVSQEKIALAAGMHPSQYGRIERAEVDPSIRTMARVARALQVTPAQLLEGVEWAPPFWLGRVERP